jgi:hypothetical protein
MNNRTGGVRSDSGEKAVRWAFWIIGITAGAVVTYTTRHFVNGDAINYIEMGEALRFGHWWDLVNLTESPGYAILLGLGQVALNTTRANEVPLLKSVNFVCFIFSMWTCDLLLQFVKERYSSARGDGGGILPWSAVTAFCYCMFLFCALNWVRPRLVAPEMIVFSLVLLAVSVVVWIKEDPEPYFKFVVLGLVAGVSYIYKTFFFPFSMVYFVIAGLSAKSLRSAAPRMLTAAGVMLLISAPLVASLSLKVGRFSYGEAGNLTRKIYVGKRGQSVNTPVRLAEMPEVLLYRDSPFVNSTRPAAFDPSYWTEGSEPVTDPPKQLRLFIVHLWQVLSDCPWLTLGLVLWFGWNLRRRTLSLREGTGIPTPLIFGGIAIAGIALYCTIHVEMRYLAPFMFLLAPALVLWPRYGGRDRRVVLRAIMGLSLLSLMLLGLMIGSVVDQSRRSLNSTERKPSYREAYYQMVAVKDFLEKRGVRKGSDVAVVGFPPVYWGRLGNLRIIAEIPKEREMLDTTPEKRMNAISALRSVGVETLVAKGAGFEKLAGEGWELVPGTRDYFVRISGDNGTGREWKAVRGEML